MFSINSPTNKKLFVIDNFYSNPDEIRNFALLQEYKSDIRFYKGLRSATTFRPENIKAQFESIMGEQITQWNYAANGVFQLMTAEDFQVYHCDFQKWAAIIYLTPNAPFESGTRFYASRSTGIRESSGNESTMQKTFSGGFYDSTKFETVDSIGNIYNRLIIMRASCIHSAGPYFGNSLETGRLTHLFFFD
jgi:hypothetical protein